MTQAAARSSEPTAARAATMPLASRLRSIQTWEYIIRHVCCRAHTWEHLIRHVHAGDARPLPVNPCGVPGMPKWCPLVTKWPQARPRCPARLSLAGGGGCWPWAIIYSQWPPQKMQLRAHGMLMAHVRDLGFSHVCAEITTSTCMDSMLYTYMSSKHAITVHILCVVPWAQPSPSWRAPCSSNQGMCTWVNEC